jgi:MtrB/PioB family decaheme-associated outer membrane protein
MKQQSRVRELSRSAVALAVLAAFASAQAQDKKEEPASTIEKQASVEVGVAGASGDQFDRAFWGQYNGMRNQDFFGIFNLDYSRRDTSTGTWLDIVGSNLGLQTREVLLNWSRQGSWQLFGAYSELRSVNPYTINTAVQGTGTTTPSAQYLPGGAGSGGDTELATKRKGVLLGGSTWLGSEFQFEGSVDFEKKTGNSLFGIGNTCPATAASGCSFVPGTTAGFGVLYYPQPIDYDHTRVEARVNYAGSALQLSGGYYGSFFTNGYGSMTPGVPATLNNAVNQPLPAGPGLQGYLGQTVALAPESQFNSLDLTGSYVFMPELRANFKVAYSQGKQDQEFTSAGLAGAPAGVGNLGGEVNSTLAQLRVVGTPIDKLTLVGEYRFYDQDDETPVVAYNRIGTTSFTNQTVSREVNSAKLEASYRFPWKLQGLAGVGWTSVDRSFTPTASYTGISAQRESTDETSWWLQVGRSMTENISGWIKYTGSSRDGSDWLAPASSGVGLVSVSSPAALGPNAIFMPTLADRDRSSVRLMINWMATEALSVQFSADYGRDDYDLPSQFALQETKFDLYTIDLNYALSENWNLNGYVSTGSQKLNQARPGGYILAFDDSSLMAGIGFTGRPSEKLQVGGNLSYISNTDKYEQTLGANPTAGNAQLLAVTGGLPDVLYRRTELRLFGTYTVSASSSFRLDAAYQRLTFDDWGWRFGGTPFLYSDNSSVYLQPDQDVGYLGLSYVYSWR